MDHKEPQEEQNDSERNAFEEPVPDNSTRKHDPKKDSKSGNSWNSAWLIFLVVFGMIFLWNSLYKPARYEIPLMQIVKLVEQGNATETLNTRPAPESQIDEAHSPAVTETPSILIIEGRGKHKRTVKYSMLNDIRIGPYEVTGTIIREIIDPIDDKNDAKPKEVVFFSGRQGLTFDNNELFNQFKKHGFENVSAEGPPSFIQSYGEIIIGAIILLVFLFFLMKRIGASAMAFGQNRDIQVAPEDIEISFENVAGVDEAVDELREIVDFLKRPEKFQLLGGRIPKGVLLVGPPGTGKTLLAKAVAGEAQVPFFSLSGSDFVELYAGVGAARVRDLFQQAQRLAPCIVFIDELDALGKARSANSFGAHDEREQTLNALLVEMDGFGTNSGTIVMAATNRPEILDSALLRSGRFDRQVLVDRPDIAGREEILKIYAKEVKLDDEIDLHQIASITSGFVGADLAALVNEAALLAARLGKSSVTMGEFTEAVERVTTGLQKKRRVMTDSEKRRVSFHECGHAIVASLLPKADPVHKVSIIPRGMAALGYTLQRPDDERYLMTKNELQSRIQVLLAGTIAEELFFDDISTGAQNDLQRATEIAKSMVMSFGMSSMGPVNYSEPASSSYLNENGFIASRQFSEETAWKIDQEIRTIIDEMFRTTRELLAAHREILENLANRLLEKEVLDTEELHEVIGIKQA